MQTFKGWERKDELKRVTKINWSELWEDVKRTGSRFHLSCAHTNWKLVIQSKSDPGKSFLAAVGNVTRLNSWSSW